jgi:hypothetical protein
LVFHGSRAAPSLHLVTASDHAHAAEIGDELLAQASDGVGVEVWCEDQRLHARGVTPPRKSD